jgi:hypothetical protein
MAKHQVSEVSLLSWLHIYGADLIAPLFNLYAFSAHEIYLQPNLPRTALEPDLVMAQTMKNQELINFWNKGVCRGMTNWFFTLYLRTKTESLDLEAHLRTIAAQFYPGAPKQAALLHALHFPEKELLNLQRDPISVVLFSAPPEKQAEVAGTLEAGLYELFLPNHRLAYIKVDAQLGYLIDPSIGVIRVRGNDHAARVANHCLQYKNSEDPTNKITFVKVS